jgi:hypothetical protein
MGGGLLKNDTVICSLKPYRKHTDSLMQTATSRRACKPGVLVAGVPEQKVIPQDASSCLHPNTARAYTQQ